MGGLKVIIVSALSLSLRDKERLRDRESLTKRTKNKFQDIFTLQKHKGINDQCVINAMTLMWYDWKNLVLGRLPGQGERPGF